VSLHTCAYLSVCEHVGYVCVHTIGGGETVLGISCDHMSDVYTRDHVCNMYIQSCVLYVCVLWTERKNTAPRKAFM
jgi:hypothetical protein